MRRCPAIGGRRRGTHRRRCWSSSTSSTSSRRRSWRATSGGPADPLFRRGKNHARFARPSRALRASRVRCSCSVLVGLPALALARHVKRIGADLVVLGTRHRERHAIPTWVRLQQRASSVAWRRLRSRPRGNSSSIEARGCGTQPLRVARAPPDARSAGGTLSEGSAARRHWRRADQSRQRAGSSECHCRRPFL